jgi:hypothetical protein
VKLQSEREWLAGYKRWKFRLGQCVRCGQKSDCNQKVPQTHLKRLSDGAASGFALTAFADGFFLGVFLGVAFAGLGCSGARSTTFRRPAVKP